MTSMSTGDQVRAEPRILDRAGLDAVCEALRQSGHLLIGPRVRDQAIVYDEIESTADLPVGLGDDQEAGRYRLLPRRDDALFGYVVGPHSWKKYLFPPAQRLYAVTRNGRALAFRQETAAGVKLALIGVRACELAAMAVQDRVFIDGDFVDEGYRVRRENAFILAVNCTQPGHTCFCASMGTGPRASAGFDLSLTELLQPGRHEFLVTIGSEAGGRILANVPSREADSETLRCEASAINAAARHMGRALDTRGLPELLYGRYEDGHWGEVAGRCLACGNCTMVCPTCFCSTVEDLTDLSGDHAERWRKWDSCFNADFSYIHGGAIRSSVKSRYRQWMVHKLASWHDQFGTSGCVGCGRCITWCPVGIDITQEAARFREGPTRAPRDREGATP